MLVIVVITHRELPRVHDVDRLVTDALGHSSTLRESCPYEQARIHRTLGLYGLAIWSPHGSFMGVSICDPYGSITGLSIMGPVCDVYGLTHMGLVFGPHMGHLRVCPYEVGILAPHGSIMSLSIWTSPYTSLTGPIWACFLGPTWVLCGHVHMV